MTPKSAIDRVLRHGATSSLKSEMFTKKGVSFYREFRPGVFHRVQFVTQRFSDADVTAFSMELGVVFVELYESLLRKPFPQNPLSVVCDVMVDIGALTKRKDLWTLVTRRATPDEASIGAHIVTLLSDHAYPFLSRIDSIESGYDAFLSTPQAGMSDLVRLETKVGFLMALDRMPEAAEAVRRALAGRGADAEDPFAESVRELARNFALQVE